MVSLGAFTGVAHGSVVSGRGEWTSHRGVKKSDGNQAAQPHAPFVVPIGGHLATLAPLGGRFAQRLNRQYTGEAQRTAGDGHRH